MRCNPSIKATTRGTMVRMSQPFETLPGRIFLDSCTAQSMANYGEYIWDGGSIADDDRLHRIPDGLANVECLRRIAAVSARAQFEWIVSSASLQEAAAKNDPEHMQWLWDIAAHADVCLFAAGPTDESEAHAARIDGSSFGYLSAPDRLLLRHALALRCEAFLTVERRLPRNSAHIERELGLRVLTPTSYWALLEPWAALWV
jgi:hypothetical protein